MAVREILTRGESALTKVCHPVTKFDQKLWDLIDDMKETLAEAGGVGLAAPQVGILRRVVVIDVGDGIIELVNPRILRTAGSETTSEGCLSFPGEYGLVERPTEVEIEAEDRHGKTFRMTGHDLLARAFCHETDHLDGKVFKTIAIEMLDEEDL